MRLEGFTKRTQFLRHAANVVATLWSRPMEPKEDKELRTVVWFALLGLIAAFLLIGAVVLATFL